MPTFWIVERRFLYPVHRFGVLARSQKNEAVTARRPQGERPW
jgi:hypothetical protein